MKQLGLLRYNSYFRLKNSRVTWRHTGVVNSLGKVKCRSTFGVSKYFSPYTLVYLLEF